MLNGFMIGIDNHLLSEDKGFKVSPADKKTTVKNGQVTTSTCYTRDKGDVEVRSFTTTYLGSRIKEQWVEIENTGSKDIKVTRVDSMHGVLPAGNYRLKYFKSSPGNEFIPVDITLEGTQVIEVVTGRSSKGAHPWFTVEGEKGDILACAIAWSGNWIVRFEPMLGGQYRISGGLNNWNFHKDLKHGDMMEGVHVMYTYMPEGDFDHACIEFNRWGRKFWYPENMLTKSIPVEWNHWWPYEDVDINEDIFKANVDECVGLGIDICTLDAGWFGEPDANCSRVGWSENVDWFLKRGDWHKVNTLRFPSGIRALADYVHSKGLKFGIWCEIEAIGKKADLASIHPEYLALRDGERLGYVCMGNPETVKWAFGVLESLIIDYCADWIKLDFNLDPKAGCNRTDHCHGDGDGLYEHYMGYYRLLDMIGEKYPEVILENCSSGGMRIDLGLAKRTHVAYLSDPDPTVHHLQVFWGCSTMLNPSVCFHFAWSQNRVLYKSNIDKDPIKADMPQYKFDYIIRASMLNFLGYSYKLPDLPGWCKERLAHHTHLYKDIIGKYVRDADMYRLTGQALRTGEGEHWNAYLYVKEDMEDAVLFAFRLLGGEKERCFKLKGLDREAIYKLKFEDSGKCLTKDGFSLMNEGILFNDLQEESSELVFLEKIEQS